MATTLRSIEKAGNVMQRLRGGFLLREVFLALFFTLFVSASVPHLTLSTSKLSYLPLESVEIRGGLDRRGWPCQNYIVALSVSSPDDFLIGASVTTDENGIFSFDFRLPYNAKSGLWSVWASAVVGDENVRAWTGFYVPVYNITLIDDRTIVYQSEIVNEFPFWLQVLMAVACVSVILGVVLVSVKTFRVFQN